MKKLIACLLAAVMLCLPVLSMGEGAKTLTLTLHTDAQQMEPLMWALLGKEGLGEAAAELVNALGLTLWQQPDGMGYSLQLKDTELLGMDLFTDGEMEYLLISAMPGYAMQAEPMEGADAASLADTVAQLDFSAAADAVLSQCLAFAEGLAITEEQGSFAGDAFSGGVRRQTFSLDDAELSRLLDACLTAVEEDAALTALAGILGENLSANIGAARDVVEQAGTDNAYAYQASIVYDEAGSVIGLSGTAMQGKKQVATLSVGLYENYVEAVWGYGFGGVNYYLRCIGITEEGTDGGTTVNLLVDMLADTQRLGYSAIASQDSAMLEGHAFSLTITPDENGFAFGAGYEFAQMLGEAYAITFLTEGTCAADPFNVEATAGIHLNYAEEPILTASLSTEDSETRTFSVEGLRIFDLNQMDDDAWAELEAAYTDSASDIMVKLFKLIPAQLLMPMLQ